MDTKLEVHKFSLWLQARSAVLCSYLPVGVGTKNWDLRGYSSFPWYYLCGQICAADLLLLTKVFETPEYGLVWTDSVKMLLLRGIRLNLSPFKS